MTNRNRASYLPFLIPGAVLLVAVIVVPFAMNLGISLTKWSGVGAPEWIGLDNYRRLAADGVFWASFRHNVGIVVAMAVLPTMAGLVIAAALFDFVGRKFGPRAASVLRACIYLPQVLPIAVAGIVWTWILAPDGALNDVLRAVGLGAVAQDWLGDPDLALYTVMGVLLWIQVGYPVVIFVAGMQRVDPALHEAAELDGASWWGRFWHVTVPQIRPEIFVVLLTCTIAALKVFPPIYVLTRGGPGGATNVPSYYSFQNFFERTQVGYGAAIATVLTVLILVLTTVFLRVQNRGERA
ncbi:sugar ABC transporter permease [Solihabitans fulvus]|uniref:Sugar ABC transporter permease n=1 Tax=Solihabitans fulvus TaxID=1892852 RepID=A0A5B2WLE3_9PSEU|nr:sugar ABC transporter permease [Solihabitans fulvus]KAA2252225.1 sugar ABC transporter permease [Solihabitans fulvus]